MSIYHYDDTVNPHKGGFLGIRTSAYSPVKHRQKYFGDARYRDEGIVDYDAQLADAEEWLKRNLAIAAKESEHVRRTTTVSTKSAVHSVRNIYISVAVDRRQGKPYYKSLRISYQCKRNKILIKSINNIFHNEADLTKAWSFLVEEKLKTEGIYPRKLWREYYMKQKPSFRKVKSHFKDKLAR